MKGMEFLEKLSKTDCTNIVPLIAGLWLERFCARCEADFFQKTIQVQTIIFKIRYFSSQAYDNIGLFKKQQPPS